MSSHIQHAHCVIALRSRASRDRVHRLLRVKILSLISKSPLVSNANGANMYWKVRIGEVHNLVKYWHFGREEGYMKGNLFLSLKYIMCAILIAVELHF